MVRARAYWICGTHDGMLNDVHMLPLRCCAMCAYTLQFSLFHPHRIQTFNMADISSADALRATLDARRAALAGSAERQAAALMETVQPEVLKAMTRGATSINITTEMHGIVAAPTRETVEALNVVLLPHKFAVRVHTDCFGNPPHTYFTLAWWHGEAADPEPVRAL